MNLNDDNDLMGSQLGDAVAAPFVLGAQNGATLPLINIQGRRARAWRLTFNRVNRVDGVAFQSGNADPNGASPVWRGQDVAFAAATLNSSQVPPRRGNEVFDTLTPGNGDDVEPIWLQLLWGTDKGLQNAILAHWPMLGGSIVVHAKNVRVYGGVGVFDFGNPAITASSFPRLSAEAVPVSGCGVTEAGDLGFTQRTPLPALTGGNTGIPAVSATPSMDGLAIGPPNLTLQGWVNGGNHGTVPSSAVYNTAPFISTVTRIGTRNQYAPKPVQLVMFNSNTVPQFQLVDNQVPDGAGVFQPSPGNVGIVYRTDGVTGVKTVADLEALINTSTIIRVFQSQTGSSANKLFAGFTNAGDRHPTATGLSTMTISAPTPGRGAFYVPDFARRVRVTPAVQDPNFNGEEFRIGQKGVSPINLVWYDNRGKVVFSELEGSIDDVVLGVQTYPPSWHVVPPSAVVLAVYATDDQFSFPYDSVFAHWRLAP